MYEDISMPHLSMNLTILLMPGMKLDTTDCCLANKSGKSDNKQTSTIVGGKNHQIWVFL